MTQPIQILTAAPVRDAEGFNVPADTVLASVRTYFEPKNSTEKWRNNAVFAEANALFRFRKIPGVDVTPSLYIMYAGVRYNIISAEDVRGRGMYIEAIAKAVSGSG